MPATLLVQPDPDAVARRAAELLIDCAEESIRLRGRFRVALSGGGTPGKLYRLLADSRYCNRMPWSLTEVYWGDERHLPAGGPGRNDSEVLPLLADVGLPASQIHTVPYVTGDVSQAAAQYEQLLRKQAQPGEPLLDLAILGLGTDGHTASLFPGTAPLEETERLVVPNYAAYEDRFPERVTLTFRAINDCETVLFIVTGSSKRAILRRVLAGPESPPLPAQRVQPSSGRLFWLMDEAARPHS